jgi:hypothetical protein
MRVVGRTLQMIRGDSESIRVSLTNKDNTPLPLVEGDKVYFTVKINVHSDEKKIQKIISSFTEGVAIINIAPADTKNLIFGDYVYDVQINRADGRVTTVVPPSKFSICEEVTYE